MNSVAAAFDFKQVTVSILKSCRNGLQVSHILHGEKELCPVIAICSQSTIPIVPRTNKFIDPGKSPRNFETLT